MSLICLIYFLLNIYNQDISLDTNITLFQEQNNYDDDLVNYDFKKEKHRNENCHIKYDSEHEYPHIEKNLKIKKKKKKANNKNNNNCTFNTNKYTDKIYDKRIFNGRKH
jgi:hypothetical protein